MNKFFILSVTIAVIIWSAGVKANAQDSQATDSLYKSLNRTDETIRLLKNIQFFGYLQSQFQVAEKAGIKSFAGGDFPEK